MYQSEGVPQNARSRAIANMRRKSNDESEVRSAVKRRDSRNQLGVSSLPQSHSLSPSPSPRPAPREPKEGGASEEFKSALIRRNSRQTLSVETSVSPSPRPSRLLRISDLPTQPEEMESTPTERRRKSRLPDTDNLGELDMTGTSSEVKSAIKRRVSRQNLAECEADQPGSPMNMKPWRSEPAPEPTSTSSEVKSALTRRRSRHNVDEAESSTSPKMVKSPTNKTAVEVEVSADAPSEVRSAIKRRISRSSQNLDADITSSAGKMEPSRQVGDGCASTDTSQGFASEDDGKSELASCSPQPSTAVPSDSVDRISGFTLATTQGSAGSPGKRAPSQDDEPQVSENVSCQKATSSHADVTEQLAWPGPGSGSSGSNCPEPADELEQLVSSASLDAYRHRGDNAGSRSGNGRPGDTGIEPMKDVVPSGARGFHDAYAGNATNSSVGCREKPASEFVKPPPSKPAALHVDAPKELSKNGKSYPSVRERQREQQLASNGKQGAGGKQPTNSTAGEPDSPPASASPTYRQRMSKAIGQVAGVLRKGL